MDLSEDRLVLRQEGGETEEDRLGQQEVDMDILLGEDSEAPAMPSGFRQYVRPEQELPPHRCLSPQGLVLEEVDLVPGQQHSDVSMIEERGQDSGNHSSEEELEEIITKSSMVYSRDCKRKWTDQSDTSNTESDQEFEEPELEAAEGTTPSTSSCDTPGSEEGEPDHNHNLVARPGTPLQFSTSPPGGVHRPRRSMSPPPRVGGQASSPEPQHFSLFSGPACRLSSSLGDLSRLCKKDKGGKKTISPRKRSRTSRVQHIQRPCLDFEKMQQLRARAVSWRHGGELSLFCW